MYNPFKPHIVLVNIENKYGYAVRKYIPICGWIYKDYGCSDWYSTPSAVKTRCVVSDISLAISALKSTRKIKIEILRVYNG